MSIKDQLSEKLDQHLLDLLDSGNATSADLAVIRNRLKDCGLSSAPLPGTPIAEMHERAQATAGLLLVTDIDDEDDKQINSAFGGV